MKRGDVAREAVRNTIIKAFEGNFVGMQDKKIFVQAQDGPAGEMIQFAISLTMPKVPLFADAGNSTSVEATSTSIASSGPVVLAKEDEEMVNELMRRLHIED